MRVITGTARGRRLITLAGDTVRPTSSRVKEALFSILQFELEGRRVLDLFAGSGQLGIEALSRGAKQAVFVDQSAKSLAVVKENLQKCGFTDRVELHQKPAEQFIRTAQPHSFDMIFLDPPYRMDILAHILPDLVSLLRPEGIIVAEHEKSCKIPEKIFNLWLQKEYFYGKIVVSVMKLNEEVEP